MIHLYHVIDMILVIFVIQNFKVLTHGMLIDPSKLFVTNTVKKSPHYNFRMMTLTYQPRLFSVCFFFPFNTPTTTASISHSQSPLRYSQSNKRRNHTDLKLNAAAYMIEWQQVFPSHTYSSWQPFTEDKKPVSTFIATTVFHNISFFSSL